MAAARSSMAVLRIVIGALVLLVGASFSPAALAQTCCMDRDGNGQCDAGDDTIACGRSLNLTSPFPIVCTPGATLDCRSIALTAPAFTLP
jgi:hypothetical protein